MDAVFTKTKLSPYKDFYIPVYKHQSKFSGNCCKAIPHREQIKKSVIKTLGQNQ